LIGNRDRVDQRRAEGREILGRPARDQIALGGDFLVDHGGAGVAQVGSDARIGVTVRPLTTPAPSNVHGPWQIAATGFPDSTKALTNPTAPESKRDLSG